MTPVLFSQSLESLIPVPPVSVSAQADPAAELPPAAGSQTFISSARSFLFPMDPAGILSHIPFSKLFRDRFCQILYTVCRHFAGRLLINIPGVKGKRNVHLIKTRKYFTSDCS